MRRREFISLIGSVAETWPLAAQAQQRVLPVVGLLRSMEGRRSFYSYSPYSCALRRQSLPSYRSHGSILLWSFKMTGVLIEAVEVAKFWEAAQAKYRRLKMEACR
jgi:hypothetical protein